MPKAARRASMVAIERNIIDAARRAAGAMTRRQESAYDNTILFTVITGQYRRRHHAHSSRASLAARGAACASTLALDAAGRL